jgi:hypothetical protein
MGFLLSGHGLFSKEYHMSPRNECQQWETQLKGHSFPTATVQLKEKAWDMNLVNDSYPRLFIGG